MQIYDLSAIRERQKRAWEQFPQRVVTFHKQELKIILSTYGRKVAAGEWRDYAISSLRTTAVFSIFRRTADLPIYCVEKRLSESRRCDLYLIRSREGRVLRSGTDLRAVMGVLEQIPLRVVR